MSTSKVPQDPDDGMAQVEALLQVAGGFVEPSADLRPRVLESVRVEQRRRQTRTRLTLAAAAVVVAVVAGGLQMTRFGQAVTKASTREQIARAIDAPETATQARADSAIWGLADAFWRVRERRAEAWRGDPTATAEAGAADSAKFEAQNATPIASE